jgi:hypothetical protein
MTDEFFKLARGRLSVSGPAQIGSRFATLFAHGQRRRQLSLHDPSWKYHQETLGESDGRQAHK